MRYKEGKSTRSLTMCTKSCVIDSMASLSYFAVGLHTFNVQASYRVGRLSHLLIIAPLVNEDIHSSHVYFNSKLDIRNLQYLCPVEWSVNGVSVTPALQYFTDIYSPDCFEVRNLLDFVVGGLAWPSGTRKSERNSRGPLPSKSLLVSRGRISECMIKTHQLISHPVKARAKNRIIIWELDEGISRTMPSVRGADSNPILWSFLTVCYWFNEEINAINARGNKMHN